MRCSTLRTTIAALPALLLASGCPTTPDPVPTFDEVVFPADFRFGTAIAQWQVEGDENDDGEIVDSNWYRWMEMDKAAGGQRNPIGNGFRTRFREDIQRAKDLGLDTFRLGIDWSRVEPEPDVFDEDEISHFVEVVTAIKNAGLEPVVTLYHWTVPTWVQQPDPDAEGGAVDRMATDSREVVDDFEDFCRQIIPRIKDKVDTYTVLNEPFSMIVVGYIDGRFPPGKTLDIEGGTKLGINLLFMHAAAFNVIKELDDVDADGDGRASFVGLTMTANDMYPEIAGDPGQEKSAQSINYVFNDWAMEALTSGRLDVNLDQDYDDADTTPPEGTFSELAGTLEFIGVQYYGPGRVTQDGLLGQILSEVPPLFGVPMLDVEDYAGDGKLLPHNGMGREISAAGFRDTLNRYARWGLPIIITENGTTTNARPEGAEDLKPGDPLPAPEFIDDQAAMYVLEHLWELGKAIEDGIDVRGYYHWTLADNFEWVEGRLQRFGAYSVDFDDPALPRTLNKQGQALRDIIDARGVTEAVWNTWRLDRYPTAGRRTPAVTTSKDPAAAE
jgi:beta-glucosidase